VKTFAGNADVSFGDVNLSEDSIRGPPHNPGSGGWPTIRYFNSKTGIDGANYDKKTSKAMCEELGDEQMMFDYIEEAGDTGLCLVFGEGNPGCSEKEIGYIKKMIALSAGELEPKLERLVSMEGSSMNPELKKWLLQRKKILKNLIKGASAGSDEL